MEIIIEDFCPRNSETPFETIDAVLNRVLGAICKLGIYGIKINNIDSSAQTNRIMEFSGELGIGHFSSTNIEKIDKEWSLSEAKEELCDFAQTVFSMGKEIIISTLQLLNHENFAGVEFVKEIIAIIKDKRDAKAPLIDRGIQISNKDYWTLSNIENHTSMKNRFFFGAETHNTWPKLFVLSQDGTFYCEYLDYMAPATINKSFDFDTFKAENYKWGGYQTIVEIDEETAKSKVLTRQANWIGRYLNSLKK